MSQDFIVNAYFLGNTESDGGKAGEPAIATIVTLTDRDMDGRISEESADLINGKPVETLKDESHLELENGDVVLGWYLELELPSGDKEIYFVPIDETVPEDAVLAEDVDLNGDQDGDVHDLCPISPTDPDGIVSGTSGDDLIDLDYTGDPDGDRIDNEDAILPGQAPNDDIVFAGWGDDTVKAGEADDIVFGGFGDDNLQGEAGNDLLFGQFGDDQLSGGDGHDALIGGFGKDTLSGDSGDDFLWGNFGADSLDGGEGADTLIGGFGDDTLRGGAGNDTILAGIPFDAELGLVGGNDSVFGGDDRDLITNVSAGDFVDGGGGGDDFDTLDLRGSANGGTADVTFTSDDKEDGFVTYFDRHGNEAGTLEFRDIENIIPICFTPGTQIATPDGQRAVETLRAGDHVLTRDNGIQEVCWVGARGLTGVELTKQHNLRPVRIAKGALGDGLPERDMYLSPNHRVLVTNDKTALYFEETEVLVAAKHLTALDGIDIVTPRWINYVHIMFERHEVVLSNGAWTESFQPGDYSLKGVGNAQRIEIQTLFPKLKSAEGLASYAAARRSLKQYEARVLTKTDP